MTVPHHSHPELEDRITVEIAATHTDVVALRSEMRRSFADVVQTLGQILARLPEAGGDD